MFFFRKTKQPDAAPKAVEPVLRVVATPPSSGGYVQSDEDRMFEAAFETGFEGQTDKNFYAKVAGASHPNDDGSSRANVISQCVIMELLVLRTQPNNPYDPNAISIHRKNGDQLGYIDARLAGEITRDIKHYGPRWVVLFRKATHHPESGSVVGAVIYVARLKAANDG
jgi:hypothetical protein